MCWRFSYGISKKSVILYYIKRHFNECHILSLKNNIYKCRFIHNIIVWHSCSFHSLKMKTQSFLQNEWKAKFHSPKLSQWTSSLQTETLKIFRSPNFASLQFHWIKILISPISLLNNEKPISLVSALSSQWFSHSTTRSSDAFFFSFFLYLSTV